MTETPSRRSLEGKVALVTGAGSGIGRAIARRFAEEGAAVCLADVNEAAGSSSAEQIASEGERARFVRTDVSRSVDCARAVQATVDGFGALHILVNCAGIIRRASVTELSEADWDLVMDVNAKSVFLMSRAAMPHLGAAGGSIVNIASGWGLAAGPRAAAYCASKAAVVLLTKAMALDHGAQGIRVNCICPGDTDTPMLRQEASQVGQAEAEFLAEAARRPLRRIGRPEEIAGAALFLASDAARFITGTALVVDGGGLA
ncbi:MAG TPA: SDR family oxidoreductase [Candidatus Acidoferrales bacterium]|nr:SDR family oxidoreductase [Candidatus Acidoferrales bacterium]